MHYIKIILLILPLISHALDELKTKQTVNKLRYISEDGKITYYQKNSGELQMSTNYNFANLLKLKPQTQYLVYGSKAQQRILISVDESFHSKLNSNKNLDLYTAKMGDNHPPIKVAKGVAPKLHLNDSWFSYFDQTTHQIKFKSFTPEVKDKVIQIKQSPSALFEPDVFMISPNDIIYTNINNDGVFGVFLYSFTEGNFKLIYKGKRPGNKINLCINEEKLIIGEFPIINSNVGSSIITVNIFKNEFKDLKTIYSSALADLGNMICDNNELYFIKTISYNPGLNQRTTEVASLNIKSSTVKVLTDLKFATNILKVNNKILVMQNGKFFIIKGKNNLTQDEINVETKK